MSKKYKNIITIGGDKILLDAFVRKARDLGRIPFKGPNFDRAIYLRFYNNRIDEENFSGLLSEATISAPTPVSPLFQLPRDWEIALTAIQETVETGVFALGDWIQYKDTEYWGKVTKVDMGFIDFKSPSSKLEGLTSSLALPDKQIRKLEDKELEVLLIQEAKSRGFKAGARFRYHTFGAGLSSASGYSSTDNFKLGAIGGTGDKRKVLYIGDYYIWDEQNGWAQLTEEPIIIVGHTAEFIRDGYPSVIESNVSTKGYVQFGCQSFTYAELSAYRRLVSSKDIKGTITVNGVQITLGLIDRLISGLKK